MEGSAWNGGGSGQFIQEMSAYETEKFMKKKNRKGAEYCSANSS